MSPNVAAVRARIGMIGLVAAALGACSGSSPTSHRIGYPPVDISGSWTATDFQQRVLALTLTQHGHSVAGTGTADGVPVTVAGQNLAGIECAMGECMLAIEVSLRIGTQGGDTLIVGGGFADTNHVAATDNFTAGPPPGFPFARGGVDTFAVDTFTLSRSR